MPFLRSVGAIRHAPPKALPTLFVIGAQIVFLTLGIAALEFHVSWMQVAIAVVSAALAELAFANIDRMRRHEKPHLFMPFSAVAAGLGIGIFFRASAEWYFALAALLAIGSKYLVRIGGVHVFNPSNFGVVVTVLLFTGATTIEFTQWGQSTSTYLLVAAVCFAVCWYAGALATTLSFLASYAVLLVALTPLAPDIFSIHHYGLLGPSLVLFASFMLTDPRTSPQRFEARLVHGFSAALLFFALEALGVRYSLFIASFAIAALNGAARFAPEQLKKVARMHVLPNSLSAAIVAVVAFIALFQLPPSSSSPRIPSLQYVLFGVESAHLARCDREARFQAVTPAGLTLDAATAGVAWADYDDDGDDDLFLSNIARGKSALYRNNGDGTFTDTTIESGLPELNTYSAFFADYDNSGTPDLFLVVSENVWIQAWEPFNPPQKRAIEVYKNVNGAFRRATDAVGLGDFITDNTEGTLSFADYDNDGYLDFLYVGNGEIWYLSERTDFDERSIEKAAFDPRFPQTRWTTCDKDEIRRIGAQYPHTTASAFEYLIENGGCIGGSASLSLIAGTPSHRDAFIDFHLALPGSAHLFRNNKGRFVEEEGFSPYIRSLVHQPATVRRKEGDPSPGFVFGRFWQPVSFDYDNDGLSDIFLNDDFGTNVLLKNRGDFSFTRELGRGIEYFGSGMGVAVADFNKDAMLDLATNNVLGDFIFLNRDGVFDLAPQLLSPTGVGWGMAALDFDLDGREDIAIGNGDVMPRANPQELSRDLFRGVELYRGTERGFVNETGAELCPALQSVKGLAVADYNNDGAPDIFATDLHKHGSILYENSPSENAYLAVKLEGTRSNRMGVGARVTVTSSVGAQTKSVFVGESFYSQNSQVLLFGLGAPEEPVTVSVEWPSGARTEHHRVEPNQVVILRETLK